MINQKVIENLIKELDDNKDNIEGIILVGYTKDKLMQFYNGDGSSLLALLIEAIDYFSDKNNNTKIEFLEQVINLLEDMEHSESDNNTNSKEVMLPC